MSPRCHHCYRQQKTQIDRIPTEIVVYILEFLDFRSVLTCKLVSNSRMTIAHLITDKKVCSLFRAVIENNARLRYTIEVALAAQEEGFNKSMSPAFLCPVRVKSTVPLTSPKIQ